MVITDFRVQSVLRTFGKQLQRRWQAGRLNDGGKDLLSAGRGDVLEESSRWLIDRVTSRVLEYAYARRDKLNAP